MKPGRGRALNTALSFERLLATFSGWTLFTMGGVCSIPGSIDLKPQVSFYAKTNIVVCFSMENRTLPCDLTLLK